MIGTTLSHFKISAKLGEGGMGEVYLAEDTDLKRKVALRVLPADLVESPERLGQFQREAESLAALNHPNIVHVFSVEVDQEGDSEVHYLTMELVEGESLEELIPEGGLPLEEVLDLAIPIADALTEAHDRGIVHRDLKPANVVVDGRGTPKILDFGLAKIRQIDSDTEFGESASATQIEQNADLETLAYMSPEQVQAQPADRRSDLFSFGSVLYEMLTGRRAFQGESSAAIAGAVIRDSPPPLNKSDQGLPRALQNLLDGCLEKDPESRLGSASEVRDALQDVKSGIAPTYRRPFLVWFRDELWRTPVQRTVVGLTGVAILAGAFLWISRGLTDSKESSSSLRTVSPRTEEGPSPAIPLPADGAIQRGRFFAQSYLYLGRPDAFDLAMAAFQEAFALEPDRAETSENIARLYANGLWSGAEASSLIPEIERWAHRALELDSNSVMAWRTLSEAERLRPRPNHKKILEFAFQAVSLDETEIKFSRQVVTYYSVLLGLETYRYGMRISAPALFTHIRAAINLMMLGRPDESLALIDDALQLEPDLMVARLMKPQFLLRLGRIEEAREWIDSSSPMPDAYREGEAQVEFEMILETGDSKAVREELPARFAVLLDPKLPFIFRWRFRAPPLIEALARHGYTEEALDLISQMSEAGFGEPPYDWLRLSSLFDPMRDDPRFQAVEAQAKKSFDLMMEYIDRSRQSSPLPAEIEQARVDLLEQLGG